MSEIAQVLAELKKLNGFMEQILCVQKLQAEMWKAKSRAASSGVGGATAEPHLEGAGVLTDLSLARPRESAGGARDASI